MKLVTEQNLNVAQAGRQLDIDPKSIGAWIAQAERGALKAILGAAIFLACTNCINFVLNSHAV